ncbi:replication endonuclease, partial [Escherichia coli]|nr:replication endonuclease [Escherichia coli]
RDEKTTTETDKTPPPEERKQQKLTIPEGDPGEWLRSLTPIQRKQLTQQLKNEQNTTKTANSGGFPAPEGVVYAGAALAKPEMTTRLIAYALSATGEELHSGAALSVYRGAHVRLPDGRIVHWDESTGSLKEVAPPKGDA